MLVKSYGKWILRSAGIESASLEGENFMLTVT